MHSRRSMFVLPENNQKGTQEAFNCSPRGNRSQGSSLKWEPGPPSPTATTQATQRSESRLKGGRENIKKNSSYVCKDQKLKTERAPDRFRKKKRSAGSI